MMMPQGTMFVLASSVCQLRYPQKCPMPLMTPAAQNGIQAICVMSNQSTRDDAEQHDVGRAHQRDTQYRKAGVDVALEPVVGCTVAVARHRILV